jgi:peptide/nickel transport system substrate-binding protein
MRKANLTRRDFLRLAFAGAAATAETPTAGAPAGGAAAPIAGVPRGQAKDVPREISLIIMWTVGQPGIGNPYPAGFNVQPGTMSMHEPLYFFSAYGSKTIPWLADGDPRYAPDFTDVTINIRKGIEWSDGQPFTARDVAFTLTMLRDNPKLTNGAEMKKWVKDGDLSDGQARATNRPMAAPHPNEHHLLDRLANPGRSCQWRLLAPYIPADSHEPAAGQVAGPAGALGRRGAMFAPTAPTTWDFCSLCIGGV